MATKQNKLPDDVAARFNCLVEPTVVVMPRPYGEVDLRTITVEQAEKLVDTGLKGILERKPGKKALPVQEQQ